MNPRGLARTLGFALAVCGATTTQVAQAQPLNTNVFIIEAEDFNYGGGQHQPVADVMPYYGGAYQGLGAVHDVDYHRNGAEPSSDEYRVGESPNVPANTNPDLSRGGWEVTTNFKLGWISDGVWCNYTRDFPPGLYRAFAALSYGDTAPSLLRGTLQRVTSGATNKTQTLQQLGSFDAPGTGAWGQNALVPLLDANRKTVLLQLAGLQTIRFTAGSGDIDYYQFLPVGPPRIAQQPTNVTVQESRPATFTVQPVGDDPVAYRWQSNQVDIAGATNLSYTLVPRLADNGTKYRCTLTNLLGSVISDEATLSVIPETDKPKLIRALSLGPTTVRVTFDEGVTVPAGPASASFALDGGIAVSAATAGLTNTDILLTVSPMTFGTTYHVTVNNVTDLSSTPNLIEPNSTVQFIASEYAPTDIGNPSQPGTVSRLPGNGFEVTADGIDIGGTSDQFHFGWEERVGDFDIQARVAAVTITDAFVHAGLMARETLDANARFAAVFASSVQLGCFFEARATVATAATTATPPGGFPVNYPQTWLRLRRTGTTLTGYASVDGQVWVPLGSRQLSGLPNRLYFGLAVSSETPGRRTTAQFRDVGPTASTATGNYTPTNEPLGPSSRATGLVISEIMYHPPVQPDGKNLQFIELYNARTVFEDLTGWRLSGDIDFRFPDGFTLQAGEFVVIAAAPADLKAVYGVANVLGPYTNALPHHTGTIHLRNNLDALRLDLSYSDTPPWPAAPDGTGHSLVLARPSYGENDPRAWAASERIGGSPGGPEAVYPSPQRNVLINEFLAHTDDPQLDYIELYNHSNQAVDLSGCYLSDDPATNKFRIPDATSIPALGFMVFNQTALGFHLNAAGETIYLVNSNATAVLDAIRFAAQENGVASGRSPDGAPTIRRLAQATPGQPNASWRSEEIVINEIMFNPISGDSDDEYVELYNRGGAPLDLTGWRFTAGINFKFPTNTTLAGGGYLVVGRDAARLRANYPQLNTSNTLGNYTGSLANGGEHLALAKPDTILSTNEIGEVLTNQIHIVVADVAYGTGGRWGRWADGGGSSLELMDPRADPWLAANWADSDESQKGEWTTVSLTGKLDNGNSQFSPNRLYVLMQGEGECLVDDVEVFREGGTNLLSNGGFELGTPPGATSWSFFGNHSRSSVETEGAGGTNRCLHVRGLGDGDTGINSIRAVLGTGLASGATATIRARVRWLAGWPEVLFRLRGNWLESSARMSLPRNLGTPGQANSRWVVNAGPAIAAVTHRPALPRANQPVVVTCRVSDPDGLSAVNLRYRVDPAATLTTIPMRDDGAGGDEVAGDGVYSATISGRGAATLIAFRIEGTDAATPSSSAVFPAGAPQQECLIRWEDPLPAGNLAHYHLWNTQATEQARRGALDNTYRDATLVYGNFRVIYNAGFRDKGSPYHGGSGDFAVTVPPDDPLLGTTDRVFASTGNGGSEETAIRSQLAAWLGQQMGIPYLHAHYMQLYRNGGQFRNVMEDLEQPSGGYAKRWFPSGADGELYKVAVWFEFQDDNSSFGSIGATLERFITTGSAYKLARYRWMFQQRPVEPTANHYTNLFDLVSAANDTSTNYASRVLNLANLEQWMRIFAYHRVMGNWDSWSFNVGQNMYLYKRPGERWVMMPWDIDFTFGLGNGPSDGLSGGQDPVVNRMYNEPAFRRMLWRGFIDAVNGPMLPEQHTPPIEARRTALLKNGVTSLAAPKAIYTYLTQRRTYLLNQIKANNVASFAVTSNGGKDYNSTTPATVLNGTAPFVIAGLEVNGIPYPVTWTDQTHFQIVVPLPQRTNLLSLAGTDRFGRPIPGASNTITVTYTGALLRPEDFVVINEVQFHPAAPNASFLELFNRSTTTPFDLSGCRLDGLGYTFAEGALIQPNSYLVLAQDRAGFAAAYGAAIPVFDVFPGTLDNGGEHLALVKPGATAAEDRILSDVRYDDHLPWPTDADGLGPSLQLTDAAQDEYRVANWTTAATNDVNRATPGRANSGRQALPPFPPVWLNEVLPDNRTSLADNAGEHDPWIELHNSGTDTLDLSALYLTDNYTNLTQWQFPAGTVINPKGFLLVWADGQPEQAQGGALHTSFRLNPTNGSVALVRLQGSPPTPAVIDYLDYVRLAPDRSFGSFPDGEPRKRRLFHFVTPYATNNPASPPISVTINELMAANTRTITDPADGHYEDWFELYNAGNQPVDLTAYTLTDVLTNANKFAIPPGTVIPAGGFLLVWADQETRQNVPGGDLHVNFKLSAAGEQLGLFAPEGTLIDGFTYGPLTNDVSLGRFPDGAEGPLESMETPTPRQPNVLAGSNKAPVLTPIGNRTVAEERPLGFTVNATDPDAGQTLTFSLGADAPAGAVIDPVTGLFAWTPTEAQGPGSYSFAIRVRDNGVPQRSATERITVTVTEANRPPVLAVVEDQTVDEGLVLAVPLQASDPDLPPNALSFSLDPGAPAGVEVNSATGLLTWRPTEDQGPGTYAITVRVTDNGSPPLSDTKTFQVKVNEVNNPPILETILPQTVEELSLFTVQAVAHDPDDPAAPLRYSLDIAPAGALIDPATGTITWTPTEAQGPTNAVFVVRATENTPPGLSSTITFAVSVTEKNQPPVLAPIADRLLYEGEFLVVANRASDLDLPPQPLTFSLGPGAPAGLEIDGASGVLTWAVGYDQGPTTNTVTVRVTDNGSPALSDARSFTVTVRARPHVVINEIMYQPPVPRAEFIELYNDSTHTTEALGGARLTGALLSFSFPAGTLLPPGAFLLVVKNRAVAAATYTNLGPVAGEYTGDLSIEGDTLRLSRAGPTPGEETVLDEVAFSNRAPWPSAAAGRGASLQLVDSQRDHRRVGNWAAVAGLAPTQPRNLIAMTNLWRYDQSGKDFGPAWRESAFDDAAWPAGRALLYVENANLPAPKNTALTLGRTAYYFRTSFQYSGPTTGVTLKISTVIDDGAVMYLNGKELYRLGITNDVVNFDTFATRLVGDATNEGPFTVVTDNLRQGENILAAEAHQNNSGSSDIVFGMTLDLEGANLAPCTPGYANSVRADLPAFPPVWLNEVLPANTHGVVDGGGHPEPWIELYNAGAAPYSLAGYFLTDSYTNLTRWAFPNDAVIDPGQFLLVWADGEPGEQSAVEWHTGFRLSASAGTLALSRLQNGQPAVLDYLDYRVSGPDVSFGSLADGEAGRRQVLGTPTPEAANRLEFVIRLGAVSLTPEGSPQLTWTSRTGDRYRVEFKDNLIEAGWRTLSEVTASAESTAFKDTTLSGAHQRFYRVRLVE